VRFFVVNLPKMSSYFLPRTRTLGIRVDISFHFQNIHLLNHIRYNTITFLQQTF
jgi:hypothetical protein